MNNRLITSFSSLCALLLLAACTASPAPFLDGMGAHHRSISTSSPLAQRYFDQGLVLTYGFNHDEAVRSFRAAIQADPDCAIAYWGVAYALGPNINMPMEDPEVAADAYKMAQAASQRASGASPAERALIEALLARYADPPPEDRAGLDLAYADAMRGAWQAFPDDADVGVLFAESMMDLRPWDQWTREGEAQPGTMEVLATLESVLRMAPEHPGANHYYIHATEASSTPERAEAAADRLLPLVPGIGHLVHMPSHNYIRIGRYKDAMDSNRAAVAADRAYFDVVGPQAVYEIYAAHNSHFQAYAAMFAGNKAEALRAGRELIANMPHDVLYGMPGLAEGFLPVILHVMVRFGMWDEILTEPKLEAPTTVASALWHYARGVAFANTGRAPRARQELAAYDADALLVPEDFKIGLSDAADVLRLGRNMLLGEILIREGDPDGTFEALRAAVAIEDAMPYEEPRGWMQPVRHALGALLLEEGRFAEAEVVYREELEINPENGWSLHGLAECLHRRGAMDEAADVERRFRAAWSAADIELGASCFCRVTAP